MQQEEIEKLSEKLLSGRISDEERLKLETWYASFEDKADVFADATARQSFRQELWSRIESKAAAVPVQKQKYLWGGVFMKIAASLLLLVVCAASLYYMRDGLIEMIDPIAMKEVSNANGRRSVLHLADGSKVHLGVESRLRYPEKFNGDVREIYLEGEAFFEVTRDEHRPFVVHSGAIKTIVLGTSFNIRSYAAEPAEVTVATGRVGVWLHTGPEEKFDPGKALKQAPGAMLVANEQVTWEQGKAFQKRTVNAAKRIAWKDGVLEFNNEKFADVVNALGRWYGKKIVLKDKKLGEQRITLKQEGESLENVLEVLRSILEINYSIRDQVIEIDQ